MIGNSIALNFPNSLEYADISYLGDLHDSGNSINVSAKNLQFVDLTGNKLLSITNDSKESN
jgi:hypothetical protein